MTNDRDGWISPFTDRRPCSRAWAKCVAAAWFQLVRALHSSGRLEHSSHLFLCCVNPLACVRFSASIAVTLCLSPSYPNSCNHVKQNLNNHPRRLPRVYTVAGSCCRQRFLAHAVHALSHTPGSWCPTLLWVSDGTGPITLLRLVSSLGPLMTSVEKTPYSVLDSTKWCTICDQTFSNIVWK